MQMMIILKRLIYKSILNLLCFATLRKLDKLLIRQNKRCLTMANFLLVKPKIRRKFILKVFATF